MTIYKEPPGFTPELIREWDHLLADFIWWFQGFEASSNRRQRQTMPDIDALRRLREDLIRLSEGRPPLDPPSIF